MDLPQPATLSETRIDVGGYQLALYRSGAGAPAVILEAGAGADASIWAAVQQAVAGFAEVCAFDRPGSGRSDPAAWPRSDQQIVEELHTLLTRAAVPRPYILVGHSSGGLNMRMYATRYPDTVAGLVLVDAVHPEQFRRAAALLPLSAPDEDRSLAEFRAALEALNGPQASDAQPGSAHAELLRVGEPASLGALRLIVLTATHHDLGLPDAISALLEQDWLALQQELRALSSDSLQIVVQGCGHNIHVERPEVVVEAIRRIVDAARRQRPLSSS